MKCLLMAGAAIIITALSPLSASAQVKTEMLGAGIRPIGAPAHYGILRVESSG